MKAEKQIELMVWILGVGKKYRNLLYGKEREKGYPNV